MFTRPATRRVVVTHRGGVHARPSLAIVSLARRFKARLKLRRGTQEADAGDILQVMSLGAPEGTELQISADGPDADAAADALAELIENNFGMGDE